MSNVKTNYICKKDCLYWDRPIKPRIVVKTQEVFEAMDTYNAKNITIFLGIFWINNEDIL